MPDRLTIDTIDAELAPGARNALRVCLRLQPDERITIITDEATRDIAAALQAEVEEIGSDHAVFVLENYDSRPLTKMPRPRHGGIYRATKTSLRRQTPTALSSSMTWSVITFAANTATSKTRR